MPIEDLIATKFREFIENNENNAHVFEKAEKHFKQFITGEHVDKKEKIVAYSFTDGSTVVMLEVGIIVYNDAVTLNMIGKHAKKMADRYKDSNEGTVDIDKAVH